MSGFGTKSLYEWECPVCGNVVNLGHEHIGDPPKCGRCGHYMKSKEYHTDIYTPPGPMCGLDFHPDTSFNLR